MDADLDTLATELYVRTDDLLKAVPERAPWRDLPEHLRCRAGDAGGDPGLLGFTRGKTYIAPDGKTYRPSMFLTLTCPSYGTRRARADVRTVGVHKA